jgi:hypothetical protein
MDFTYISGVDPLLSWDYFFHKVSFIVNTIFPRFRDTLHAGRTKPLADASKLTPAVVQRVLRKMGPSECILQVAKQT